MAQPVIKPCTCDHSYQDKKYGAGMRVHNPLKNDGATNGYRCTVCSDTKKPK